jgi:hypothetical protein
MMKQWSGMVARRRCWLSFVVFAAAISDALSRPVRAQHMVAVRQAEQFIRETGMELVVIINGPGDLSD